MAVRYFSEFEQYDNRPYAKSVSLFRIEISDVDYTGEPQELTFGASPLKINFANTEDNKLSPLRGSQATMQFVTDDNFKLSDLYTDQEMKFIVTVYKDSVVKWKGFVIPDGCSEPFIDPPYPVTVKAIDGIGVLKNIPFVTVTGGVKYRFLTVIRTCLNMLNLNMNINTIQDLEYDGMASGGDPLNLTYTYAERFIDDVENLTPMNCGEVLESVLKQFNSILVQHNGEWVIADLITMYGNALGLNPVNKYLPNGTLIGKFPMLNDGVQLGNNQFDVIHCNSDQIRSTDNAYKEVVVKYNYDTLLELLDTNTIHFVNDAGNAALFSGWNKFGGIGVFSSFYPILPQYATLNPNPANNFDQYIQLKNPVVVYGGETVSLSITLDSNQYFSQAAIILSSGGINYFLNQDKFQTDFIVWNTGIDTKATGLRTVNITFNIPSVPSESYIYINLYPWTGTTDTYYNIRLYEINIRFTRGANGITSESHISTNDATYTTKPDPIEVLNGESDKIGYSGTMFKSDQVTPTNGWRRVGGSVYEPFLTIASKSILFMYGRPMNKYEGSIYSYFDYFSIFTIQNLDGLFIPVSLSYDIKNNQTKAVLIEISSLEVPHQSNVIYE